MIRLWGIIFGLTVAITAAIAVSAVFAKATEQLGGDVQARASDLEAA